LPCLFGSLPLTRWILLKEQITIVHGHSSFSSLAHETLFHASVLKIHTVFTDHSLFGFADISSILTNKILELSLAITTCVICVSHTSKENTVLRAKIKQTDKVYAIPNAIDPSKFVPIKKCKRYVPGSKIRIIVMSRLVYRKGMDLLAGIIPKICAAHPYVDFIIGGDGHKRLLLEETVEHHQLLERIKFLGEVAHADVGATLNSGDIFLNTSLTEAFCIAILEAACCGLQVVSTKVGGVPEVLPSEVLQLAEPNVSSIVKKLDHVIGEIKNNRVMSRQEIHDIVAPFYTWQKVAERTEKVYDVVLQQEPPNMKKRTKKLLACGWLIGKIFVLLMVVDMIFIKLLNYIQPHRPTNNVQQKETDVHANNVGQKPTLTRRPLYSSYPASGDSN